ncbi:hypothetical protein H0H87_004880 [Tephrocybe sp. NHM501043]|nr:hypothetical protein H0H87_004880 [Tephrocybe sp. NHM501043]
MVGSELSCAFLTYSRPLGPYPELKFPTLVSRLGQSHVQPSLLFFRTSPTSRGTARFLNETRIIPPLAYTACITALKAIEKSTDAVELHFADEEGDPYAVELAGRIGGYVVGNDSDFVVLNTQGYLGYIPLEEMTWYASVSPEAPSHEEDSGFEEVRKPKSKRRPVANPNTGRGIIPPSGDEPTLSLTIYKPDLLAAHLKIPVTLLPLVGALVGNDFTLQPESGRRNVQSLFFDKQLSLSQRITRVASTIQAILSPQAQRRKKPKHQVDSVMDLIDRAVNALLARLVTTIGSGEIDSIVEKIVEATLQYAIPKHADNSLLPLNVCALHPDDACPLLPLISRRVELEKSSNSDIRDETLQHAIEIRAQYLEAYRHGNLSPKVFDPLSSGTFWPRLFLENPDLETVSRSIGRPVREWIYAVLDDAVGLPDTLDEENELEEVEEEEDDLDELVDVVESNSESDSDDDFLAPLKGELHRLHGSGSQGPSTLTVLHTQPSRPPIVTEYLRRGTRVAQEAVTVKSIHELLESVSLGSLGSIPVLSLPFEDRFTAFLRAMGSDIPPVRSLPKEQVIPVIAVRWVVRTLQLRAEETGSKEREKEKWSRREAHCFLAAFSSPDAPQDATFPILDRNVQLTAQILQSLESIELLSQTLLLTATLPSSVHHFSGRAFHRLLTDSTVPESGTISSNLMDASGFGLESAFREDHSVKSRKTKKRLDNSKNRLGNPQALDYAQQEFPDDLAGVPRDRIEFYSYTKVEGERRVVRISEFAWVPTIARLLRTDVVDICIKPVPSDNKESAPPCYLDVPKVDTSASVPSSPKRSSSPLPTTRRPRSWFGKR